MKKRQRESTIERFATRPFKGISRPEGGEALAQLILLSLTGISLGLIRHCLSTSRGKSSGQVHVAFICHLLQEVINLVFRRRGGKSRRHGIIHDTRAHVQLL